MFKKIAVVVLVLSICIPFVATAASNDNNIEPQYTPLEVYMDPTQVYVFDDYPEVMFYGEWTGGPVEYYHVVMNYGDGSSGENYYTYDASDYYTHYYNVNKGSGYKWNTKLTVTSGSSTASENGVVEVY
jgi:hypothetical protein